ncbi:hypothetical protein [Edaphobacter aggregans]|uniref:hypothetical protein n=1 Tax=Edaphobacter aggregans TaxID=570835 RepID=UPI00054E4B30|nr:hypothetical protein [Edaphobacter aggregans]
MKEDQLAFLKSSLDQVVVLETAHGQRLLVQIIIVVDEGETPDLFCVEVDPAGTGFLPRQGATHSILLADIVNVAPPPPLPLP